MNFSDILKAISHASWTDVLLLGFTLSVTVIGACIALGVGVPLALRFLQQQRQKYSRRRAGRRRAQPIAERGWGYGRDSIQNRAPTRPHPALRSRPWVAALATFVVAVVCTLAVERVMNPQLGARAMSIKESTLAQAPARLRIDYELRNR